MSWDWSTITAISSVVGVVGGLVSVVFLILQIRRNAMAIEGSTVQALMSFEKDVFALMADNADTYIKGCASTSKLTAVDRLKFERIVGAQMSLTYSAFVQFEQRLIDDEVWDAYFNALKNYMKAPGFRASWTSMENNYPKSFRTVVNGGLPSQNMS